MLFLKLTNKEQASISWKPGPLAANVTRNMIGAASNSYMQLVGEELVGEEHCVTTLITAAKETILRLVQNYSGQNIVGSMMINVCITQII